MGLEKALNRAWQARDFEIQRYWQRALYFWGFIAVIFVAYTAFQKKHEIELLYSLIISFSGIVFSYAFYLVNKGSKFWQENWESHIDMLEDTIEGNLYKTIIIKKGKKTTLSSAAYSVSKINSFLSLF